MEKLGKALAYYKDAHAPKAVTDAFISRVEQRYLKLGKKFKKMAADWVHDAHQLIGP
jgi:hypothetical protein